MAAKRRRTEAAEGVSRVRFPAACRLDQAAAQGLVGGRFTLEAVALEAGWLVATNGRLLVRVRAEVEGPLAAEGAPRVLIPSEAIGEAVAVARESRRAFAEVEFRDDGRTVVRTGPDEWRERPAVCGEFPRTEELVPERSGDDVMLSFDLEFLRRILAALGSVEADYDDVGSWVRLVVRRDAFEVSRRDGRADLAKPVRVELGAWDPGGQDDGRSVAVCMPVTERGDTDSRKREAAPRLVFPCDVDEMNDESGPGSPAGGKG